MERHGRTTTFYSWSDKTWHYKSELPKTLQPFVNHVFSSGSYTVNDFEAYTWETEGIKDVFEEAELIFVSRLTSAVSLSMVLTLFTHLLIL